ncbi:MAG: antibiotic biosynthesis monooxygenase [Steroidobacteraceae bacterium]
MSAFNVVRFRVKPGNETAFVEAHRKLKPAFKGLISINLVKTGDRAFCFVGEWRNFQNIVAARSGMIGMLDQFRNMLEDLGGGVGLTDPVSGESVLKMVARKPVRKVARTTAKKAKRKAKAKAKAKK